MKKSSVEYIPRLEWEGLITELSIDGPFAECGVLPAGTDQIRFVRDDEYNIMGQISGALPLKAYHAECDKPFPPPFRHEIVTDNAHISLHNCRILNRTYGPKLQSYANNMMEVRGNLTVNRICKKHLLNHSSPAWLTEWYLNGPHFPSLLRKRTKRKIVREFTRGRTEKDEDAETFSFLEVDGTRADHAQLECDGTRFLVQRVPESFPPPWSEKLAIEYRPTWGCVPTDQERQAISEILSFVFGTPLVRIGSTLFDADGYLLEQVFQSHSLPNLRNLCKQAEIPPFSLPSAPDSSVEPIVSSLLHQYLNKRIPLQLHEAL